MSERGETYGLFPHWTTYLYLASMIPVAWFLADVIDLPKIFRDLARESGHTPAVAQTAWLTGMFVALIPLWSLVPATLWLNRRYGAAHWDSSGLYLTNAVVRVELFLAWDSVESLRVIPGGVQVVPKPEVRYALWTYVPFKPLIPTRAQAAAALHSRLSLLVGQDQESRVFPCSRLERYLPWIALLAIGAMSFAFLALNDWALEQCWEVKAHELVAVCSLLGALTAGLVFLRLNLAWLTRIEVRPGVVSCGGTSFALDELTSVTLAGAKLCLEGTRDGKTTRRSGLLARGRDPAELRAALEERGLEVRDQVPAWARGRRLVMSCLLLLVGGACVGCLPAGWAINQPITRSAYMTDRLGQGALFIGEASLQGPRVTHVLFLPYPDRAFVFGGRSPYGKTDRTRPHSDDYFLVDLSRQIWRDQTSSLEGPLSPLMRARLQDVEVEDVIELYDLPCAQPALDALSQAWRENRFQSLPVTDLFCAGREIGRSLPTTFEGILGPQGAARDYLEGRCSVRFFDLRHVGPSAKTDLVAAVASGGVLWVVEVPHHAQFVLRGEFLAYFLGRPEASEVEIPLGVSRIDERGQVTRLRKHRPTLDEVLVARRRVKAGEPAAAVFNWLLLRVEVEPSSPR